MTAGIHDPCCPLDDGPSLDCAICNAIAAARSQEIEARNSIWRANLRRIEARNWLDGYRAATAGHHIPEWVQTGTVTLRRGQEP